MAMDLVCSYGCRGRDCCRCTDSEAAHLAEMGEDEDAYFESLDVGFRRAMGPAVGEIKNQIKMARCDRAERVQNYRCFYRTVLQTVRKLGQARIGSSARQ